jgi:hypothetical protein
MKGYKAPPSKKRVGGFAFSVLKKNCDFLKLHFVIQPTLWKQNLNSIDK